MGIRSRINGRSIRCADWSCARGCAACGPSTRHVVRDSCSILSAGGRGSAGARVRSWFCGLGSRQRQAEPGPGARIRPREHGSLSPHAGPRSERSALAARDAIPGVSSRDVPSGCGFSEGASGEWGSGCGAQDKCPAHGMRKEGPGWRTRGVRVRKERCGLRFRVGYQVCGSPNTDPGMNVAGEVLGP